MGIIWALKTSDSLATVGRATVGPCTVAVAVALPLRAPERGWEKGACGRTDYKTGGPRRYCVCMGVGRLPLAAFYSVVP